MVNKNDRRQSQQKYFISNREKLRLHRRAYKAQQQDHSEVCGVSIIDQRGYISFEFLKNYSAQPGRYALRLSDVRSIKRSISQYGKRLLGTFHSHPLSEAIPSLRDRKNGFYRGIELIYDVCGRELKLWQQLSRGRKKILRELPLVLEKRRKPKRRKKGDQQQFCTSSMG